LSENDNTFKHNTREIIAEELGWSTGKVAEAEIVQSMIAERQGHYLNMVDLFFG